MGSEREEIARRVASFKAVQERMQREREEFCERTLSEARFSPRLKERSATNIRAVQD